MQIGYLMLFFYMSYHFIIPCNYSAYKVQGNTMRIGACITDFATNIPDWQVSIDVVPGYCLVL